jgi:alkaline phosphatase
MRKSMPKSMKANTSITLSLFLFVSFLGISQVYKVHSHNDYEQNVPFWKAISAGVSSIEADVFLKNGRLMVAHEPESITDFKTLKRLYLEPLQESLDLGLITNSPLQFLIDIKSEAEPTLDAIIAELLEYPMITNSKNIFIIISGNRPEISEYLKYPDFISFDYQSLEPIEDSNALSKVGLISLSFRSFTDWNGKGRLTKEDLERVATAVDVAHSFGKPFRFWATPDSKTAWKAMVGIGVDYINTDNPFECVKYLNSLPRRVYENKEEHQVYMPTFEMDGANETPKNIILMIGDGNGLAQISATALANGGFLSLTQLNNIGFLKTQSEDDFTTDSAAAATAMATGTKAPNRAIGVNANGEPIPNLIEYFSDAGFTTAIITSDEIHGATPSSFYAHQKERDMKNAILIDLKNSSLDLFIAAKGTDSLRETNFSGFKILEGLNDIKSMSTTKNCAFFDTGARPAPIYNAVKNLLLNFRQRSEPFFLIVEGAKIDSYGHSNNIGGLIEEALAFDKAVGEAIQFADKDKNTLVIVTADHETGGLALPQGNIEKRTIEADFTTDDHTGIFLPLFAYGPQSHTFRGVFNNTAVFQKTLKALSIHSAK